MRHLTLLSDKLIKCPRLLFVLNNQRRVQSTVLNLAVSWNEYGGFFGYGVPRSHPFRRSFSPHVAEQCGRDRNKSFSTRIRAGADNKRIEEVHAAYTQGRRRYMEDEHVILQEEDGGDDGSAVLVAVFDGHGGPRVSHYLRTELYNTLLQVGSTSSLSQHRNQSVDECARLLERSLHELDEEVLRHKEWDRQGSTALVAWLHRKGKNETESADAAENDGSTLIVANIGDSRAVLGRIISVDVRGDGGEVKSELMVDSVALSHDHKPEDPGEKHRIESLGGEVTHSLVDVPRVNGVLALSRAIGDGDDRPFVSAQPDFTTIQVGEIGWREENNESASEVLQEFAILATDGLWDVMTNEYAVNFVAAHEQRGTPRSSIPKEMVKAALTFGSQDNITIVILWLGPRLQFFLDSENGNKHSKDILAKPSGSVCDLSNDSRQD